MSVEITENIVFKEEDFAKEPLGKVIYDQCTFVDCNFEKADLSYTSFEECRFENCLLDRAKVRETLFSDVEFVACKMLGIQFSASNSFNFTVEFQECQLDYSMFTGMRLKRCKFMDCNLLEVDFAETNLESVVFDSCNLERALFENSDLKKTDFRTAINFSIDPRINNIRGAIFSRTKLDGLLQQFNLDLRD